MQSLENWSFIEKDIWTCAQQRIWTHVAWFMHRRIIRSCYGQCLRVWNTAIFTVPCGGRSLLDASSDVTASLKVDLDIYFYDGRWIRFYLRFTEFVDSKTSIGFTLVKLVNRYLNCLTINRCDWSILIVIRVLHPVFITCDFQPTTTRSATRSRRNSRLTLHIIVD